MATTLVLTGCAAGPSYEAPGPSWYLMGRTQQEFEAHRRLCEQYADDSIDTNNTNAAGTMMGRGQVGAGVGMVLAEAASHSARVGECLLGLGYRPVP